MFWAKCGKILTDSNDYPLNCPSSPCGYYSVFGIKYRYLNEQTLEPSDPCRWQYDVFPAQVKDSKLQWNDVYNVCIQVSQNKGLVARKTLMEGCWKECTSQSETGQCLQQKLYCDFCVQAYVYNLAGCFDDYQDFAEEFYSKCGVLPDQSGNYPDIFEVYYGSVYPTSDANSCIQAYWEKYFCDLYMLNFSLQVQNLNQFWILWGVYHGWDSSTWQYTSVGAYGDQNTEEHGHGTVVRSLYEVAVTAGELGEKQSLQDCCRIKAARGKIGAINSFFVEHINTKDSYTLSSTDSMTCTNSKNLCKSFQYKSFPYDNYYGSVDQVKFNIQWRKLLLTKTVDTPAYAKGVRFQMVINEKKYNTGYSSQIVYSDNTMTTEINLMFDQLYDNLPLANFVNHGMNYLSITPCKIENGYCNQDWESETPTKNQPHVLFWDYDPRYDNDVFRHDFKINLMALEYIK